MPNDACKYTFARLQRFTVVLNAPETNGLLMDDVHDSLKKEARSWIEE